MLLADKDSHSYIVFSNYDGVVKEVTHFTLGEEYLDNLNFARVSYKIYENVIIYTIQNKTKDIYSLDRSCYIENVLRLDIVDGEVVAKYTGTEVSDKIQENGEERWYYICTIDGVECEQSEYEQLFDYKCQFAEKTYPTLEEAALNVKVLGLGIN